MHELSIGVDTLVCHEPTRFVVTQPLCIIYVVPVLVMDPHGFFAILRRKSQISVINIKKLNYNRPQNYKAQDRGEHTILSPRSSLVSFNIIMFSKAVAPLLRSPNN
jgi:hypothetical protein